MQGCGITYTLKRDPCIFDIGDEEFDEVCVVIDEVFCLLTECLILGHDIYENITKPMQLIVIFFMALTWLL